MSSRADKSGAGRRARRAAYETLAIARGAPERRTRRAAHSSLCLSLSLSLSVARGARGGGESHEKEPLRLDHSNWFEASQDSFRALGHLVDLNDCVWPSLTHGLLT